jgi:hypothetical protein
VSSAIIPSEWKIHKIIPIYKSGDKHLVENYRPISLLCLLSKILESIIFKEVASFIRPLISTRQFGFMKGSSPLTQLLVSFADIMKHCDSGSYTDVIYFDYKKAFDSVPHDELLLKLWQHGITGSLWFWFKQYLSCRQHCVSIQDTTSTLLPVKSGVPQGSILGPLLFLIYVNDLDCNINHSMLFQFADDTKLQVSNHSCCQSSSPILQADINSLYSWSNANHLSVNYTKCAAMRLSLHVSTSSNPLYVIDDTQIPVSNTHRDLGVLVQSNLSWSSHYNQICSKAYNVLHLLRRTVSSKNISTRKLLYISLVRSKLCYCSQLWRPRLVKDILALERVQRRATKFILSDYSSDYKTRLINLKLLPLMYWFELNDLMFLIKSLKSPPDNFNIFEYIKFSSSNTRSASSSKLTHNFCHTTTYRHFYFNRIVRLWNHINVTCIDLSLSETTIKLKIKEFMWQHFLTHFDTDNHCTLHIICPCSSCATKF